METYVPIRNGENGLSVRNKINETFQQLIEDISNTEELLERRTTDIEYNQLSEACKEAISASQGGTIINNADDEDLVAENGVIHFKDRKISDGGMAYVILRKPQGGNRLEANLLNNISNTIFVIQYDFDLDGQTITLGNNVILRFNGGSFNNTKVDGNGDVVWATIKLSRTTTIDSDYWCFRNCKFGRVNTDISDATLDNRYNKAFNLKWIGIQDDGLDKYALFRDLYTILGGSSGLLSGSYANYRPNFVISGRIICNSNEIYIPTSMNLYGENDAVILFSSSIGDYCVCVSRLASLHNITFIHTDSANFSGSIVAIDSSKRNDNIGLEPIGVNIFENISIKGNYEVRKTTTQCTGLSIIASDSGGTDSPFFHQIRIGILDIRYCRVGLEIGIHKVLEEGPLVWGNGVVIEQAYIEGTEKCVYCHDNTTGKYGRCRIGWLTGQADKGSCKVVHIDGFRDFRIDNFMPYDMEAQEGSSKAPIAYIENGGSLKVGFDKGIDAVVSSQEGFKDVIPTETNTAYRIYAGTLCRFNKIFTEESVADAE